MMQTVSVSIHASMVVLASRSTSILADLLFVFARLIMKGLAVRSPLIKPFICLVEKTSLLLLFLQSLPYLVSFSFSFSFFFYYCYFEPNKMFENHQKCLIFKSHFSTSPCVRRVQSQTRSSDQIPEP